MIELLVEHGAELDSRTPYGETPLGTERPQDMITFNVG